MSDFGVQQTAHRIIDVRKVPHQQGYREVFEAYETLEIGEAILVLSDRDLQELRNELDRELADAFRWEALPSKDQEYRARITKLASTALPRIVVETTTLLDATGRQHQDPSGGWSRAHEISTPISSRYHPMTRSRCTRDPISMSSSWYCTVQVSSKQS